MQLIKNVADTFETWNKMLKTECLHVTLLRFDTINDTTGNITACLT